MSRWMPGDPCPHCGKKDRIKFNGGQPFCLNCKKFVDSIVRGAVHCSLRNWDGRANA